MATNGIEEYGNKKTHSSMQIILASAKIMNDRSATKGDACQSKNKEGDENV
jgi:hypothetical protein